LFYKDFTFDFDNSTAQPLLVRHIRMMITMGQLIEANK